MTSPTDRLSTTHTLPPETRQAPSASPEEGKPAGSHRRARTLGRLRAVGLPVVVLALLAYLPYVAVDLPGILPGRVNGPGSMQLLGA